MIARKGAYVVVADAGGATVYRIANRVSGVKLDDVEELEAEEIGRASDPGRDRAPRVNYSTGHTSTLEMTDLHDAAEERFAETLARRMEGIVDRSPKGIILFAPPRILGRVRRHASDRVRRALKAEVDRDLRSARLAELEAAVGRLD